MLSACSSAYGREQPGNNTAQLKRCLGWMAAVSGPSLQLGMGTVAILWHMTPLLLIGRPPTWIA